MSPTVCTNVGRWSRANLLIALAAFVGCAPGDTTADPAANADGTPPGYIAPTPQRSGDAQRGYDTLVNFGYVRCGVPYAMYAAYAKLFPVKSSDQLPGRTGRNAELPYYLTAYQTKKGVNLVTLNCMVCHSARMHGQLMVGLGETNSDYTSTSGPLTDALVKVIQLGGALTLTSDEKAELDRFTHRSTILAPYLATRSKGTNPADSLGAILAAHRDPKTLAWSDTPLIATPDRDPVPLDVPPWWRMGKKNALYYTGFGRNDHARLLMASAMLCTDSTDEADEIDARFPDVQAYIASLRPPRYPGPIDSALAERGRVTFEATCSRCHGTYAPSKVSYPNRLIDIDEVRSDPTLVNLMQSPRGQSYLNWLNTSWFGQLSQVVATHGYVAPPLDGIWATGPFLHNGSVPTLATLLDSSKRPRYFTRLWMSSDKAPADGEVDVNFDPVAVGIKYTALDHGQLDEKDASKRAAIYDTTLLGYSNSGHTFGDALSEDDRHAVIEYLKTL
jgi:mono/diheme cytochrome c family protein